MSGDAGIPAPGVPAPAVPVPAPAVPAANPAASGLTVKSPRIGGIITSGTYQIPWVGGSNKRSQAQADAIGPETSFATRPKHDYKAIFEVEKYCTKGLDSEKQLGTADDKKGITLTSWIEEIRGQLEDTGQDTIFRVYDAANQTEVYLLENWGDVDDKQVDDWVKRLRDEQVVLDAFGIATGAKKPACEYDKANLKFSAKMLKNSIKQELWRKLDKSLPKSATGPQIFAAIIQEHQVATASAVRTLVKEIEELTIKKEPGEDVASLGDKITEIANRIDGTGQAPPDLPLVIATCFIGSTTMSFEFHANEIHNKVNKNPKALTWEEVIREHRIKYKSLKQTKLWAAAAHRKEEETAFQAIRTELKQINKRIDQQSRNRGNGGGNKNNGGKDSGQQNPHHNKTCYNCNEKGHIKPNCPKLKKEDAKDSSNNDTTQQPSLKKAPKEGESHERTVKGEVQKYCQKCKRWTKGEKAHLTEEHRGKKDNGGKAQGQLAAVNDTMGSLRLVGGFLGECNTGRQWCSGCKDFKASHDQGQCVKVQALKRKETEVREQFDQSMSNIARMIHGTVTEREAQVRSAIYGRFTPLAEESDEEDNTSELDPDEGATDLKADTLDEIDRIHFWDMARAVYTRKYNCFPETDEEARKAFVEVYGEEHFLHKANFKKGETAADTIVYALDSPFFDDDDVIEYWKEGYEDDSETESTKLSKEQAGEL